MDRAGLYFVIGFAATLLFIVVVLNKMMEIKVYTHTLQGLITW